MDVLLVSQYFWPEDFRVNDLVRGLAERGHGVTVLTGKPNYPGGSFFPGYGFLRPVREEYGGAEVLRAPLMRGERAGVIDGEKQPRGFVSAGDLRRPRTPKNVEHLDTGTGFGK